MTKFIITTLLSGILFISTHGQNNSENWVPVQSYNNQKLYIDVSGLENFRGNDLYVWVMQKFNPPLEMQGVRREIFQSRTYYIINKNLKEYSILEIVFYDEDKNVIKSYSYHHDTDIEKYKYNYPIFPGSEMDLILEQSLKYIPK